MAVVSGPPAGKRGTVRALIFWIVLMLLGLGIWFFSSTRVAGQELTLPAGPLHYGDFHARFAADGAFRLDGQRWPAFKGTWKRNGTAIEIETPNVPNAPQGCDRAGRYRATVAGSRLTLDAGSGELLMATPALSNGVMYVRTARSLFAIGRK
jgi:hypothetical protein